VSGGCDHRYQRKLVVPAEEIAALIAPWLEAEPTSMVLRQVAPQTFRLILPRLEMVMPLVDHRPLLHAATFSIACKRWTRFASSVGGILPTLVEFELRGILAHAWETSTTTQILNPFAWIHEVHPDTLGPVNRTAFWCTTWTLDQASIPPIKNLLVVELPSVTDEDGPPGKRTLIYPIRISFSVLDSLSGAASPSRDDDDDNSDAPPPPGGVSGAILGHGQRRTTTTSGA
jgi:hypothetical protein